MRFHPVFDFTAAELAGLRSLGVDKAIAAVSVARDGVVSRRQLVALGLDDGAIALRIRRRTLFRRDAGVYAVGRADLTRRGELRAALLRCGRFAAFSHRTAGDVLDVLSAGGRLHLTTTARIAQPGRGSGIALHFTRRWDAGEVVWVDGLPCTSIARTLADLAASPPPRDFAAAWDNADQQLLLYTPELAAQVARQRPGATVLRRRLDRREVVPPSESAFEGLFVDVIRAAGLREPVREWPLAVEDREGRIDFVYYPELVAVELDSRKWHAIQTAQDRDREKDLALREAGFDPHRYGYRQVRDEGPRIAAIIAAALAAGQRRLEAQRLLG